MSERSRIDTRARIAALALAACAALAPGVARAQATGFEPVPADATPTMAATDRATAPGLERAGTPSLALASPWVGDDLGAVVLAQAEEETKRRPGPPVIGAERARILLRSLTVPGWGQATLKRRTSATIFGVAELGIWTSFTSFKIQEQLRRQAYVRTARILAGIDLDDRDEEFRRTVGSYLSSDQYNQLVVFRDAANLYYEDPAAYRAYIAEHSIGGDDAWAWTDIGALLRYRDQRRAADRAGLRANTALALAVINRLLSALHAARYDPNEVTSDAAPPPERTWAVEVSPVLRGDPAAFRLGVRRKF
jgi:hypothetical protein